MGVRRAAFAHNEHGAQVALGASGMGLQSHMLLLLTVETAHQSYVKHEKHEKGCVHARLCCRLVWLIGDHLLGGRLGTNVILLTSLMGNV